MLVPEENPLSLLGVKPLQEIPSLGSCVGIR